MSNGSQGGAIAIRGEEITEEKIIEYLDATGTTKSLLPTEKKMFINIAREFGLNPFKREIYISVYGSGDSRQCAIITGYEVFIKRAERTGALDGWKAWTEGEGPSGLKAIVEIHRKDRKVPFVHEVWYSEVVQTTKDGSPNRFWKKQPRFMTKKVAIGQAFRLCFSDELGGIPYLEGEEEEAEPRDVTEPPLKGTSADDLAATLSTDAAKLPESAEEKPVEVTLGKPTKEDLF
ncbi:recombinase RecT [Treponema primitia]|uniref:RecT family recombinase n=1 Tax=Treponema primitia TaxID=88058 RepID=UPI00397EA749